MTNINRYAWFYIAGEGNVRVVYVFYPLFVIWLGYFCCYRYREFESMIRQWRLKSGEYPSEYPWKINDGDLIANKLKASS